MRAGVEEGVSDKLAIKNERSFYFADFTSRGKRRRRRFSR